MGPDGVARCWWGDSDELYRHYHDEEWGRPVADDRRLFEKLMLEGFMSGLSWATILRKRENFRAVFRDFDPVAVARFGARDVNRLMGDAGIVRNRAKIEATINNARRHAELVREFGSFPAYVWGFEPTQRREGMLPEAVAMSKDLRSRGWAFVGPTTVLSFMQAMGLVNDHVGGCAAGVRVEALRAAFRRPKRKKG
ncbi:MAG TPA: DNA-3-methyladenine glycosylase I [Candidatus Acidoferrales bacterium]|nr:DNA-3-methyladenine glycosylase I [Candidatus Acidoferrales bacterium]